VFSVPLNFTVVIATASFSLLIIGSLVAGRLANRFGAKPTTVAGTFLCGVFTVMLFLTPNFWGALVFNFLMSLFGAIGATSAVCLALAQVPKSRGTMMSLTGAVDALGTTIGPAVGGVLLVLTSEFYGAVGIALGGMFVVAAIIRFLWAEEFIKT
jgi:MFS family permease